MAKRKASQMLDVGARGSETAQVQAIAPNRTRENQRNSPLLRLPAELRNQIYEEACRHGIIAIKTATKNSPRHVSVHSKKHCGGAALMHTCRQMREEAWDLFLQHTVFDLETRINRFKKFFTNGHVPKDVRSIVICQRTAYDLTCFAEESVGLPDEFKINLPRLKCISANKRLSESFYYELAYVCDHFQDAARIVFGSEHLIVAPVTTEVQEAVEDFKSFRGYQNQAYKEGVGDRTYYSTDTRPMEQSAFGFFCKAIVGK
ncbi:hypothetical protein ACEQ8H_001966 [Pleosporales sp. CAS-2024a]